MVGCEPRPCHGRGAGGEQGASRILDECRQTRVHGSRFVERVEKRLENDDGLRGLVAAVGQEPVLSPVPCLHVTPPSILDRTISGGVRGAEATVGVLTGRR